jgi:hypothetical protein
VLLQSIQNSMCAFWHANHVHNLFRDAGTEGAGGAAAPVALHQEEQGGQLKVPFQFKGLPWRNSELSEMSVQFFYEFASVQNARNAVIELQEYSTIAWRRTPSHPYDPINRKHD